MERPDLRSRRKARKYQTLVRWRGGMTIVMCGRGSAMVRRISNHDPKRLRLVDNEAPCTGILYIRSYTKGGSATGGAEWESRTRVEYEAAADCTVVVLQPSTGILVLFEGYHEALHRVTHAQQYEHQRRT